MRWIWERPHWPGFRWDEAALAPLETAFRLAAERSRGASWHVEEGDRARLRIEWLSDEAVRTSAIEGEILDRDSVQSRVREHFGLGGGGLRASPAEDGVAELMVALCRDFDRPLDRATLFEWHRMLLRGRADLAEIGAYRRSGRPMRVVSGAAPVFTTHYEAPPSDRVPAEMDRFLAWYERAAAEPMPALAWAGAAHLHFAFVHPFEDGNGRLARALAEKAMARSLGRPTLIALARTVAVRRREYYRALEEANRSLDITGWLEWFARIVLEAQAWSERRLLCSIAEARLFARLEGRLNGRQAKVLRRLFRAEPEGFEGGLSAGNYRSITGAAPSTATRDLAALTEIGALRRTGTRRHARYRLALPEFDEAPSASSLGNSGPGA